jgi:hypothetical protein
VHRTVSHTFATCTRRLSGLFNRLIMLDFGVATVPVPVRGRPPRVVFSIGFVRRSPVDERRQEPE